ncbi:protein kinase domain-containing protein [Nocardia sp. NPDC055049]
MAMTTGRDFPTAGNYQEALQHPRLCFTDVDLQKSEPELTRLRQPRAISGAFASVFPLTHTVTGHKYAVKCFTRHIPDQQSRYSAISDQLATLKDLSQPWKVGFEYLPDAVLVGADRYPVLKMEWVRGVTLSRWLDSHHDDRHLVDRLADRFVEMVADLTAHGIAHGDLQHGNILVADDGTLRLLDYDGMFVPALAGSGGTERGHRNYQSPIRGNGDFDADIDRFSAWLIYLALKAVAVDPGLWKNLHEPDGEYLLLRDEDFEHPTTSSRFPLLLSHANPQVRDLADVVRTLAFQPLAAVPALTGAAATANTTATTPRPMATGRLPSWISSHLDPAATESLPRAASGAALRYHGRRVIDGLAVVILAITLVMPLMCALFGVPFVLGLIPIAAAAIGTWAARRSRAETAALRKQLLDLSIRRRAAADVVNATAAIQRDRAQLDLSEQQRQQQLGEQRDSSKIQHDRDIAQIEQNKNTVCHDVDRSLAALAQDKQRKLDEALAAERWAFVRAELARHRVSDASIAGIGISLTTSLADKGIRTAADLRGIRFTANPAGYNSQKAWLQLTIGGEVNVHGIGEKKAKELMKWRDGLAARANARCRIAAPTRRLEIIDEFDRKRRPLAVKKQQALDTADTQRSQARQRLEGRQRDLTERARVAAAAAATAREDLARRMVGIQNAPAELARIDRDIAEARRYGRALSHTRYVRFALTGR